MIKNEMLQYTPDMSREFCYHVTYLNMAMCIANLSYAVKAKVGCLIVSATGQIISHGWNGMPHGFDNVCEYVNEEGQLKTRPEVIHAESNAILKCATSTLSTSGATMYVTMSPCINCAKLIAQAGIKRLIYHTKYKDMSGVEFLQKCGVEIIQI